MSDVFISYIRHDATIAQKIANRLESNGLSVWLNTNSLRPGDNWLAEISKAIRTAKAFIVLISSESDSNNYLDAEIATAIATKSEYSGFRIIPVLLDKNSDLPSFIDQYQYIDFTVEIDFEKNIKLLVDSINSPFIGSEDNSYLTDFDLSFSRRHRKEFEEALIKRSRYLSLRTLFPLAVTLISAISAIAVGFYLPDKNSSAIEFLTLFLPAFTGVVGAVVGYYFGSNFRESWWIKISDKDMDILNKATVSNGYSQVEKSVEK